MRQGGKDENSISRPAISPHPDEGGAHLQRGLPLSLSKLRERKRKKRTPKEFSLQAVYSILTTKKKNPLMWEKDHLLPKGIGFWWVMWAGGEGLFGNYTLKKQHLSR